MIRILYVDDEEMLLDLAKIFLEKTGKFTVETSPTAVGLVESGIISSYDAIVSDYLMPDIDGIAFLKVIRKNFPDMPFILFTGRGREEVVIEAINNGVDFYLQKGGDPKAQFAELSHKIIQAVKRKEAERNLADSEERFSQYFHTNPAITGLSKTKTGEYIDVNEAFLQRLSYSREEAIGKTPLELGLLSPEKNEDLFRELKTKGHLHNYQSELTTRTGEKLDIIISADIIKTRGEDLLLVQAIDITDRIKSEKALKENEEKFIAIFNQTPDPLIILDPDEKIIEVNHSFEDVFGQDEEQVTSRTLHELRIISDEQGEERIKDLIQSGEVVHQQEITFIDRDDTVFIAEVAISRIILHGQTCSLIQIHNINDIRKAHGAIQEANNKLNILSSITRHDILNRVMVSSLYCEEMKELASDPTLLKHLSAIIKASEEIEQLIHFTEEYQELRTIAPVWQKLDYIAHMQSIIDLAPGVSIMSELGTLEIYADLMLEKVLYNLVDNSVRHGKNLSNIKYSYQTEKSECIIRYEDDGGGIIDSEKDKIFEQGFGKNTGTGLFLIREILSITGILISENGVYGTGVKFEIRVPAGKWRNS